MMIYNGFMENGFEVAYVSLYLGPREEIEIANPFLGQEVDLSQYPGFEQEFRNLTVIPKEARGFCVKNNIDKNTNLVLIITKKDGPKFTRRNPKSSPGNPSSCYTEGTYMYKLRILDRFNGESV